MHITNNDMLLSWMIITQKGEPVYLLRATVLAPWGRVPRTGQCAMETRRVPLDGPREKQVTILVTILGQTEGTKRTTVQVPNQSPVPTKISAVQ